MLEISTTSISKKTKPLSYVIHKQIHTQIYFQMEVQTFELIGFFLVGICIDGCKDKYEEDHCIKSKDGKRITVQSKCHYYCFEKYQGYSLEHSGKCKDSSKPSACMFKISIITNSEIIEHFTLSKVAQSCLSTFAQRYTQRCILQMYI